MRIILQYLGVWGRVVVVLELLWRGWLHFAVRATGDRSHGAHSRVCKAAPAALKDRGRLKRCPEAAATRVELGNGPSSGSIAPTRLTAEKKARARLLQ
jgi:hypothetical protein